LIGVRRISAILEQLPIISPDSVIAGLIKPYKRQLIDKSKTVQRQLDKQQVINDALKDM
jgi:hypothetical protein